MASMDCRVGANIKYTYILRLGSGAGRFEAGPKFQNFIQGGYTVRFYNYIFFQDKQNF